MTRVVIVALLTGAVASAQAQHGQVFTTPEEAVLALSAAVKAGQLDGLKQIFGPESDELIASSDPATARRNQQVFTVAFAEAWRLTDDDEGRKTLVIGNEDWPFPIPLVKDSAGWRFDTASGKEEVIDRRIGRNELAAIDTARAYVTAQQRYAADGHDGQPAGRYATKFRSDPGMENGLYWPAARGGKRSPLGDLVADAARDGRTPETAGGSPSPLRGYYFRILSATDGFGLVAWPAQYGVTGVMTFIVNQDGIVCEKDLGEGTDAAVQTMATYARDAAWTPAQP